MEDQVLTNHAWFYDRNLRSVRDRVDRLEGEARTYALVTFFVRPECLPDEVVVELAEKCFAQMMPNILS